MIENICIYLRCCLLSVLLPEDFLEARCEVAGENTNRLIVVASSDVLWHHARNVHHLHFRAKKVNVGFLRKRVGNNDLNLYIQMELCFLKNNPKYLPFPYLETPWEYSLHNQKIYHELQKHKLSWKSIFLDANYWYF